MSSQTSELPAHVDVNANVSVDEGGEQLLDVLGDVRNTLGTFAVQKQKLNELGYDIDLSTNTDDEIVVTLTDI
jgi:hypothetical protein